MILYGWVNEFGGKAREYYTVKYAVRKHCRGT